jgi:uncharacterized integral membrane protein (TIGR00697 family)
MNGFVKGFAGGLSEEWNESIRDHYPKHDEARFTAWSALFGRLYQIAAIACFYFLTLFAESNSWKAVYCIDCWIEILTNPEDRAKETGAFIGSLTVFIFALFAANILAYMWIGLSKSRGDNTWKVLAKSVVKREERTALFTQLLRVLFVVSLIMSNLLSLKFVNYKGLVFVHGSIFYIMMFVLINLITVFEDVEAAVKTVFLGMISYIAVFISLVLSARMGGNLVDKTVLLLNIENYNTLLGRHIAALYLASFFAYTVTVVLNVGLLAFLLKYFETKPSVILGAMVTFISQLIDTLIFIWLGYGNNSGVDFTSMFIGQFSMKFSVYLVMYFPLYYLIQACKHWLGLGRKPIEQ